MQFDMTYEVDGSLENPIVVIVVVLWSLILSACSVTLLSRYRRLQAMPPVERPESLLSPLKALGLLVLLTPFAQRELGSLVYQLEAVFMGRPGITSVGFWGGPPVFPSLIVAAVCALASDRRQVKAPVSAASPQ
jgi:hypothetical protein